MFLYAHNEYSEGCKNLGRALNAKRIKHEGSKFKGRANKTVINWGSSRIGNPEVAACRVINRPEAVAVCSNKLHFFQQIAGQVSVPDWTTDFNTAMEWMINGETVVARTVLNGSGARGLVIMTLDDVASYVRAPLYTKYVPKAAEYRVHVVNGEIVDVQRKALRNGWQEANPGRRPNFKVRNLENGFIYMREGVNPPESVRQVALDGVRAAGLDFGACDIIYNERRERAYLLEINTAPGLEGTTVENYANAMRAYN